MPVRNKIPIKLLNNNIFKDTQMWPGFKKLTLIAKFAFNYHDVC